ncbi:hypothetical protein NLC82_04305 [Candidatus Aminicenantes bacterium AC-335-A11]|jgi:hypothetical protein|nr:hypothetical protein [SCandidatus Aminicenantes bacterium Aminicenantia_JdfR_composite]MCP2606372.1 hypothetical protein [Candidatus Aminicenantes bacterium AC-708-I09]MCP2618624.1 hypothetical protein [Candidatus Aminicenantes bacterium AC-335-A11]MCP2620975.1 hypothetical protein [Candidatus Aminicenantes bacterium AC-334-E05]
MDTVRKSIYISIIWAAVGIIVGFFALSSKEFSDYPKPLIPFIFAYIFWSTYWGWKVLHGLFKKIISSITPGGCFVIMPIIYWIMIGIIYISIITSLSIMFGMLGGGIVTFLIYLKRAGMSSKTLVITFASFLIFIGILIFFTSKPQKSKTNLERLSYDKEKQPLISETKKEPKPVLLNGELIEFSTPKQERIQIPSISKPNLDEAKQRIPLILNKIYQDFDQGNLSASSSFISPDIFSNSKILDTICKPFTYRAHYIESIIERPNNRFEVRIRILFQPMEEHAQVLVFRTKQDNFILESISEYPEEWFTTWKEQAKELVRKFYYAMKANRQDVLKELVSSEELIYPKFFDFGGRIRFRKVIQKELDKLESRIVSYKGLKVYISTGEFNYSKWSFYVDNINGENKIVEWKFSEGIFNPHVHAQATDPNIEFYTLDRFESAREPDRIETQPSVNKPGNFKVRVIKDKAEIRTEPNINSSVVAKVPMRAILEAEGKTGEWYQVSFRYRGQFTISGYIHQSFVEIID